MCKQVVELAKDVGAFIRSERDKVSIEDISIKYKNNLVTYVDQQAEKQIVDKLRAILPNAGFIVEEATVERSSQSLQWIVDPLDGTTNFLYHLPTYAVSIALMEDGEVILGVVYEIVQDECFYTYKGASAFLNDKVINVSNCDTFEEALLSTGFPYYDFEHIDPYIEILKYLMKNTKGIRRFGAAAVDLCYVACGRFDAYFEHSLSPWDVAAGAFIVKQAGGKINDFKGTNNYLFGREIIASNKQLSQVMTRLIQKHIISS